MAPEGLSLLKLSEASLVPLKMWLTGVEDLTRVDEILVLCFMKLGSAVPCAQWALTK